MSREKPQKENYKDVYYLEFALKKHIKCSNTRRRVPFVYEDSRFKSVDDVN